MNCNSQTEQSGWEGELAAGYPEMSQAQAREIEALEQAEATIAR